jgi:hypothetical protein
MPEATEAQIIDHYNRYDERARLEHDIGPLERLRTQELIAAFSHLLLLPSWTWAGQAVCIPSG